MPLIRPFAGLRPMPNFAKEVIAPPYDVLNSAEARQRAAGKPWSFLHISKAEIDMPLGTDQYEASVYAKAAESLKEMIRQNILMREDRPHYYVYRLIMGTHVQTGLVAAASVKAYDANRIRKHEHTRPAKERDRIRHIEALNAQTGPVLLAYKSLPALDSLLNDICEANYPVYDLVADDGIGHRLWVVEDCQTIDRLTEEFDAVDALYIADGHHRSAAGSRVAAAIGGSQDQMSQYFLSVIFPHNQMKILDYNRVVSDLNGLTVADFIARLEINFICVKETGQISPDSAGQFGMFVEGQWYRLTIKPGLIPEDPVGKLDVSILANYMLSPVLNISDPRTDQRIDFVGGIRGLSELERRVTSGGMAVAIAMFPTRMEDLMAVADANEVMPPKSTWFEPKLADGLISHVLD